MERSLSSAPRVHRPKDLYYNQKRVDSGKAMKSCKYTDPDSSPNKERTVPISLSITKPPS